MRRAAAGRMVRRAIIGALPSCLRLGPLDNTHPVRTGDNSSPRDADEQAMLHDARDGGKPARESLRIGYLPQLGVQQAVPAIRDESMAVRRLAKQRRSRTPAGGGGLF